MIERKALGVLSVIGLAATLSAAASLGAQPTVVGTIVEVSPDTRAIVLQVGVVDGDAVLRRFRLRGFRAHPPEWRIRKTR